MKTLIIIYRKFFAVGFANALQFACPLFWAFCRSAAKIPPWRGNFSPLPERTRGTERTDSQIGRLYIPPIGRIYVRYSLSVFFIAFCIFQSAIFNPQSAMLFSQTPPDIFYQWAKNIGSTSADYGKSIAVDTAGNTYITGFFQGTADFDPGAGTANLTPVGVPDIFFAKYNSSGAYQWAKNIGSATNDAGNSIAVDDSGNTYITGYYQGAADSPATA